MKKEWFSRIKGLGIEEVSNENMTIYFLDEESLEEAVKDLSKKVKWNDNWLMIGFDDETDDVIFIDESTGEVCTAYEFNGKWEVVTLFPSVNLFLGTYGY
ncbi:hypothetical protein [Bacillus sp. EAC]|uniref:hypothetical protein n=1 Tax=Bacillus sp. EAC TaxID=1978338 RepID=UPI000B43C9A6|nr:hypothetical protein [Bacillus sp. EAC]